jgi:hypothetical protein
MPEPFVGAAAKADGHRGADGRVAHGGPLIAHPHHDDGHGKGEHHPHYFNQPTGSRGLSLTSISSAKRPSFPRFEEKFGDAYLGYKSSVRRWI